MLDFLTQGVALRQPAGCKITVDNREIKELYGLVTEVRVVASRLAPTTAQVVLAAPLDEKGIWRVQDTSGITAGARIRIDAKFGLGSEEVFRGFVNQVTPSYPANAGQARVTFTCRDETLKLDRNHDQKKWLDKAPTSDMIIVNKICGDHGLTRDLAGGVGQSGIEPMQNGSDMAFLKQRADANGYELYAREGRLYFGPMRLKGDTQPPIMVYAGRRTNCVSFDPQEDSHHPDRIQVDVAATEGAGTTKIEVTSNLDMLGLRPATGKGSAVGSNDWRFARATTPDADAARTMAQAYVNQAAMRVTATGELDGALYGHVLRFGELVAVDGAGSEWSGKYYVDSVTHLFSTSGYKQNFSLSRNARGDNKAGLGGLAAGAISAAGSLL